MTEDLACGDFGQSKFSAESLSKLNNFIKQLNEDHEIKGGSTALYFYLVSVISDVIEEKK